jgi:hypothetical protein
VVFGMPREAIALGAADIVARPEEIRQHLEWQISHSNAKPARSPSSRQRPTRYGERIL